MFDFYVIINEKKNDKHILEIAIVREKIINLAIDFIDPITSYAEALKISIDFFTNCNITVFSKNIFVTNSINEWFNDVSQKHETWKSLADKLQEKHIKLTAFTMFEKNINSLFHSTD